MCQWIATKTCAQAEAVLSAHHVACGPVHDIEDAVRQPQVSERELVAEVNDPVRGKIKAVSSVFTYTNAQSKVRGPAPMLGQHNDQVLREWLGYSQQRICALYESKVLEQTDR
jgi:CoA:oxalate CoA-transferase